MPTALIIAILVALFIITASAFAIRAARKSSYVPRLLTALAFAPIALFCLYGFMAAMEPGDFHVAWRVLYLACFASCAAAILVLLFARSSSSRSE